MKILARNCRGLRNRRAVQELVDIVQAQDRMVVFLLEKLSSKEHMKSVRDWILFNGCFMMSNDDRGGGLAILWKVGVDVWVDSFSKYYIDFIVHGGSKNA